MKRAECLITYSMSSLDERYEVLYNKWVSQIYSRSVIIFCPIHHLRKFIKPALFCKNKCYYLFTCKTQSHVRQFVINFYSDNYISVFLIWFNLFTVIIYCSHQVTIFFCRCCLWVMICCAFQAHVNGMACILIMVNEPLLLDLTSHSRE